MCEARMVMSNWYIQYKVINWPKPHPPEDVRRFIGFVDITGDLSRTLAW